MKKDNLLAGVILIGIAVALMLNGMGFLPYIPWFKLICTGFLLAWTLKSLREREFFGICLSLGIIAWLFDKELGIQHLTPFPLLAAVVLLGIGLDMIFAKKQRIVHVIHNDSKWETKVEEKVKEKAKEEYYEQWQDGRKIVLENVFNSTSKYVSASAFDQAQLENVFGSVNIYFNNAVIANGKAYVKVENVFGRTNIYFPKIWRVDFNQEAVLGRINIIGEPNYDMSAPCVVMDITAVFGDVNIYFE